MDVGRLLQRNLSFSLSQAITPEGLGPVGTAFFQAVSQALIEPFLNKALSSVFGGLFGGIFHTGAERGPVPGRTGQNVGGVLQAGEWVFTPQQIQNLATGLSTGAGGGITVEANFQGNIDPLVQRSNRRHINELAERVALVLSERGLRV